MKTVSRAELHGRQSYMDGHKDLAGKGYRIPDVRVPGATVIYVSISPLSIVRKILQIGLMLSALHIELRVESGKNFSLRTNKVDSNAV